MKKIIVISGLMAMFVEAACFLMLMSGGVFFGPLAYVGIWLLLAPLHLCRLLFGDSGVMIAPILAFFQFFIPIMWLVARKYGKRAA